MLALVSTRGKLGVPARWISAVGNPCKVRLEAEKTETVSVFRFENGPQTRWSLTKVKDRMSASL